MSKRNLIPARIRSLRRQYIEITRAIQALENLQSLIATTAKVSK